MRLWSLHPKYLDKAGLAGCWREGLLAKSVLTKLANGEVKVGYRNHSQLIRFKQQEDPVLYVSEYLHCVVDEAEKRGYKYNRSKLLPRVGNLKMKTTTGQILIELAHLISKLKERAPQCIEPLVTCFLPDPHPMFEVFVGEAESWEKQQKQ